MSSYLTRNPRPSNPQYLRAPPTRSPKRISVPAGQRLSTIVEAGGQSNSSRATTGSNHRSGRSHRSRNDAPHSAAASPITRLHNTPLARRFHLGDPPLESDEKKPPSYRSTDEEGRAAHEDSGNRSPRWKTWLQGRGGWGRVILFLVVLLVALAIALGVGLGVGLKSRDKTKDRAKSNSAGGPSDGAGSQPFPLGTWNLPVALTSTSTNCTSNAGTWNCFPYQTYTQSTSASRYTFNWVISSTSGHSNDTLNIASSPNPFGITFHPTALNLEEAGSPNERYVFSLPLPKQDDPGQSLTQDGSRTTCFFNQTVFEASLYTHLLQPSGADTGPGPMANSGGNLWPGTVYVRQTSPGGPNTPDCYPVDANGNLDGPRVSLNSEPQPQQKTCSCVWDTVNATTQAI